MVLVLWVLITVVLEVGLAVAAVRRRRHHAGWQRFAVAVAFPATVVAGLVAIGTVTGAVVSLIDADDPRTGSVCVGMI